MAFNLIPLTSLLMDYGILSEPAMGGQEAIDMFIANRKKKCCKINYQLVFMDLNMPEVDGITAAQKILSYQR